MLDAKPLSEMSRRSQIAILATKMILPGDWRIDSNGMICPDSFLNVALIESYFKSPARYSYYLSKKLEGEVDLELQSSQKVFIPDIELRRIVKEMIRKDFNKERVKDLDVNARLSVARKLKYRYASSIKQIARMVHLEKSALEGFI